MIPSRKKRENWIYILFLLMQKTFLQLMFDKYFLRSKSEKRPRLNLGASAMYTTFYYDDLCNEIYCMLPWREQKKKMFKA